jgi:hypothetical protein
MKSTFETLLRNYKEASFYVHLDFTTINQCCRSAIVSMPNRIRLNISMQILINGAKPTRIHADLDPVRLYRQEFEFLLKNIGITKWVIGHKAYLHRFKSLSQISGLFVSFWSISCLWIRIRIPNTDLDPITRIQCRSLRIPIYNTQMIYTKLLKTLSTHTKKFSKTNKAFF